MSWLDFAKNFAGPIVTAIAAVVAARITYVLQNQQISITKSKLKLDFFEKRYKIFITLKEYVSYVVAEHFVPENINHGRIREYRVTLDEARFLCGEKTLNFIRQCDDACEKLIFHITANQPIGDQPRLEFAKQASIKTGLLRELYADIPRQFERELRITKP